MEIIVVIFGTVITGLLAWVVIGQAQIHVLVNSKYDDLKEELKKTYERIDKLEDLLSQEQIKSVDKEGTKP